MGLDSKGNLRAPAVRITNSDQNVFDATVARYATGFAVAYRFLPTDPKREAVIRIAFTDELGNIAGTRDVAPASREPGLIRAALARDGRLFVGWTDHDSSGSETVRVVRAICE